VLNLLKEDVRTAVHAATPAKALFTSSAGRDYSV
jgi:hypothetical protein